jgi:O-antigen/teichoic acid export membrane protein
VRINLVAVLILVPAILCITPRYGATGAAAVWLALNAGYVTVGIYFMHRRLIPREKWRWYGQDIAAPLVPAVAVAALLRWVSPNEAGTWVRLAAVLTSAGCILAVASIAAPATRQQVLRVVPARIKSLCLGMA